MLKDLKKYLDNSADCDTIVLECSQMELFKKLDDIARASATKYDIFIPRIYYNNKYLFCMFIRELWDIAYSHGEMDTKKENNLEIDLTD